MVITLITTTGGRPEAWRLCERWMCAQDYTGPVQWIVVDDCEPETEISGKPDSWNVQVCRPAEKWRPGDNTQHRNLLKALERIEGEIVFFIEDDDYYAPQYLSIMVRAFGKVPQAKLLGEAPAVYYHVGGQCWQNCYNHQHASLCQTAIRWELIRPLTEIVKLQPKFVDCILWQICGEKHGSLFEAHGRKLCVGMKGLPGRRGIGIGHNLKGGAWKPDASGEMLELLIGNDAEHYRDLLGG